jgi:hypothetical protein
MATHADETATNINQSIPWKINHHSKFMPSNQITCSE